MPLVEKRNYSFLVEDISSFANKRVLHLVESFLEILLVFADQKFADGLKLALTLSDGVDLDAFNEDLDQRGRFRELSPCERQAAQRD